MCWANKDPKLVDYWGVPYPCNAHAEDGIGLCEKHYAEIIGVLCPPSS